MKIYKGEKYLVIDDRSDHYYFLKDKKEIEKWLEDGSFAEGALLFEISNPHILEYETTRKFTPLLDKEGTG